MKHSLVLLASEFLTKNNQLLLYQEIKVKTEVNVFFSNNICNSEYKKYFILLVK